MSRTLIVWKKLVFNNRELYSERLGLGLHVLDPIRE